MMENNNYEETKESSSISHDLKTFITESLQKHLGSKNSQENTERFNVNVNREGPSSLGFVQSLNTATKCPNTLCSLTLAKIQEDSVSIANNNPNTQLYLHSRSPINGSKTGELKTPDSLGGAPPSYSFVLRQALLPRPSITGTFIPSPSFVMHTPPPNYATAFDIYIDNPIPNPIRRYRFGYMPMYVICPVCGYIGITTVVTKIIMGTHLCALLLCLLCCWACAPLPYVLRSCKEVHHYCSNCRVYLGMYNPTNPVNTSRTPA